MAAAALLAGEDAPEAVLLVVPSDHVIADAAGFCRLVDAALPAALAGHLVTFAITPSRPETGYGYIRMGEGLAGLAGVRKLAAFVEKPDAGRAAAFLAAGDYFWNSGMFLFSVGAFLAELERHAPAVLAAARGAVATRRSDLDFIRLGAEAFAAAPSISIDYAVMEKTDKAASIACDIGWTDVGAWSELWRIGAKDGQGNVLSGDVLVEESENCLVRNEQGPLTAVLGCRDLMVVATGDAVLVAHKDATQDIKLIVDRLRRDQRSQLTMPEQVHRPWGYYQTIHAGQRFQVKRLTIKPGGKLSLQKHYHRAEHWVVVEGTALVTKGEETSLVRENESIYIPLGSLHRLENPGKVPLSLIEVQSGAYRGEDDIVRLDDTYGRQ